MELSKLNYSLSAASQIKTHLQNNTFSNTPKASCAVYDMYNKTAHRDDIIKPENKRLEFNVKINKNGSIHAAKSNFQIGMGGQRKLIKQNRHNTLTTCHFHSENGLKINNVDMRIDSLGEVHNITTLNAAGPSANAPPYLFGDITIEGAIYHGKNPFQDRAVYGLTLINHDGSGRKFVGGSDRVRTDPNCTIGGIKISGGNFNNANFDNRSFETNMPAGTQVGANFSNGDPSTCPCKPPSGGTMADERCCLSQPSVAPAAKGTTEKQCTAWAGTTWCNALLLMRGASFKNTSWMTVGSINVINNTDLTGTDFSGAMLGAEQTMTAPGRTFTISNSIVRKVNFSNVNFGVLPPDRNTTVTFINSDLSGAIFDTSANLENIEWVNVTCPDGTGNMKSNSCIGHTALKPF